MLWEVGMKVIAEQELCVTKYQPQRLALNEQS